MIRLKIRKYDDKSIHLTALGGIDHFGFGTFLCDIKSDEIECDEFSKEALLQASYQSGLQGMEIWPDNRIAWGAPSHEIVMPIKYISKDEDANEWLEKIKVT